MNAWGMKNVMNAYEEINRGEGQEGPTPIQDPAGQIGSTSFDGFVWDWAKVKVSCLQCVTKNSYIKILS